MQCEQIRNERLADSGHRISAHELLGDEQPAVQVHDLLLGYRPAGFRTKTLCQAGSFDAAGDVARIRLPLQDAPIAAAGPDLRCAGLSSRESTDDLEIGICSRGVHHRRLSGGEGQDGIVANRHHLTLTRHRATPGRARGASSWVQFGE